MKWVFVGLASVFVIGVIAILSVKVQNCNAGAVPAQGPDRVKISSSTVRRKAVPTRGQEAHIHLGEKRALPYASCFTDIFASNALTNWIYVGLFITAFVTLYSQWRSMESAAASERPKVLINSIMFINGERIKDDSTALFDVKFCIELRNFGKGPSEIHALRLEIGKIKHAIDLPASHVLAGGASLFVTPAQTIRQLFESRLVAKGFMNLASVRDLSGDNVQLQKSRETNIIAQSNQIFKCTVLVAYTAVGSRLSVPPQPKVLDANLCDYMPTIFRNTDARESTMDAIGYASHVAPRSSATTPIS